MATAIAYCASYPGIGIARVGDSADGYFIGPELPDRPAVPDGGFKDRAGRVKRQAARFRVFGFDADGRLVRELTAAEADIRWTVHLVNRKAAADAFLPGGPDPAPRNGSVRAAQRDRLVIDPGPRGITGPAVAGERYRFDSGTFLDEPVDLGELRTDEAGRLLVLGGHGRSGSPGDTPLRHFADNDGWFDDTADGPVTVEVTLRETGEKPPVRHTSWVVVAPPDFAPTVTNLVTLYDVAEQAAVDAGYLPMPTEVCYPRDVAPIFERASGYQWVSESAFRGHRQTRHTHSGAVERPGDLADPDHVKLLASPDDAAAEARRRVFERIREPIQATGAGPEPADRSRAEQQASALFMPPLSGDSGGATPGRPGTWLTVTGVQYERLRLWAAGKFEAEEIPTGTGDRAAGVGAAGEGAAGDRAAGVPDGAPTPDDLDRAALQACTGGPFFPGIEVSSLATDPDHYVAPFRLRPDLVPGSITARMAVPWQSDFADCRHFWWPAQRPDDVIVKQDFTAVTRGLYAKPAGNARRISTTAFPRHRWDRGVGDRTPTGLHVEESIVVRHREMVDEWSNLGFVLPERAADGSEVLVETDRHPYLGLRDRDYFHIMLNLDRYPDFLPVARQLADRFLHAARQAQRDPDVDADLLPFRYSELALDARLDSIYGDLVDEVAGYAPDRDAVFRTRSDVIERLRQFGPLNQTDGLWLRNVATIGPIDELTGYLTRIWIDEVGGGDPAQNHSNIYTALLAGVGIETAPVASRDFAHNDRLLDSAFTLPLLQLVISQFTDQYLPELLGMTLSFEWESVGLGSSVQMLREHGIDDTYYALHVAIDNAEAGHGALAKRAVRRYLAGFREEAERQRQWARIWDGYVAFRLTGTLGEDLRARVRAGHEDRVLEIVERKRRYGSLNHGPAAASAGMYNNLFDRPAEMLDALVASGQVVPGHPDRSPFLKHLTFGGPMYQVFTPDEVRVFEDWIRSAGPRGRTGDDPARPAPAGSNGGAGTAARARKPIVPDGSPPHRDGAAGLPRLHLLSSAEAFDAHPRKTVLGYGCVH